MEGGEEGGTLVEIPNRRLCSNCEHGALATSGVYCTYFREPIFDERAALECGEFDPQPEARAASRAASQAAELPSGPESSNGRSDVSALAGPALEELAERHLERSFSTLWGQAFDVKSAAGRAEAARWLAAEVREMAELAAEEAK